MAEHPQSDSPGGGALMRLAGEAAPLARRSSDAGDALASAARTEVEGRYLMAHRFPRSIVVAAQNLLDDCARPGFAATARYSRPVGKEKNEATGAWEDKRAEGFSIRFAEAALLRFGNMTAFSHVVAEDDESVTIRCGCLDYETNAEWHTDVIVPKTQERRKLKEGQKPLKTRRNSYGDEVYIVPATAADIQKEIARATSIYCRTAIMRMIPRDVQDDCTAAVQETQAAEVKRDPAAALKKLLAAFKAELAVNAEEIAAYVGHSLDGGLRPDEIVELRAVYMGVKEGHFKWAEVLAERTGTAEKPKDGGAGAKVDKLRAEIDEKVKAKKKGAGAAATTAASTTAPAAGEQVDEATGEVIPPPSREPGGEG